MSRCPQSARQDVVCAPIGRTSTQRCSGMPPVEETVAAHLCPASAKILGSDISLPFKLCKMTPMTIRMTIWPARLTARPTSEQCRVATHTGYSCTSFVGALVDQVAKAAMSIQCSYVSYGSYSRDLALGPRCDKA